MPTYASLGLIWYALCCSCFFVQETSHIAEDLVANVQVSSSNFMQLYETKSSFLYTLLMKHTHTYLVLQLRGM